MASLGGVLFGFGFGVISGALPFLKQCWGGLTAIQLELITYSGLVGSVLGALTTGRLSDRIGRRTLIIAASIIFAIGSMLSGASSSATFLILSRIVVGLAVGIASFITPLYISEISPSKHRGALVTVFQLMITIGIFISYFADLALANEANPFSWRSMFYLGVIPSIILFTGMLILPETPRFLISTGRISEGRILLQIIEKEDSISKTVNQIQKESQLESKWSILFKPPVLYPLLIAIGIMFFQQFIGINTIIFYIPGLFLFGESAGSQNAILATAIIAALNVIATLIAIFTVDKIGRRKLYFIGLTGILVSLIVLSLLFKFYFLFGSAFPALIIISVMAYIIFFAASMGPLAWLIISEIFPLKLRGLGMSIGSVANWLFNTIITVTFVRLTWFFNKQSVHSGSENNSDPNLATWFLIYAIVAALGLWWGYKYLPETNGKTLEDIDEEFSELKNTNN